MKEFPEDKSLNALYDGKCSCEKPCDKVINILVMGQTGSGKTTLVDTHLNYLLGIEFYDEFRYKFVDERGLIEERKSLIQKAESEEQKAQAVQIHSMTSSVTIYHVPSEYIVNSPSESPCCINIIDTPGFGDTRGHAWDVIISQMIAALLKTITTLNYILITCKSSTNRVDEGTKFIYSSIQDLYANDISKRVIGMFTFSDGNAPQAKQAIREVGIDITKDFAFNNASTWAFEAENKLIDTSGAA